MARRRGRGLVPQRPLVRIVLLLAVAGMASGIAGAVFTGSETTAGDPVAGSAVPPATPPVAAEATPPEVADEPAAAADDGTPPAAPPSETAAPGPPPQTPTTTVAVEAALNNQSTEPAPSPESTADTAEVDSATPPAAAEATPPEVADEPAAAADDGTPPAAPPSETAAPGPPPQTPTTTVAGTPVAVTDEPAAVGAAAAIVEQLRLLVAETDPAIPGYDRDHFAGWLDADGDCVNTGHEILQSEAISFSMNAEGCAVTSGEWFDPYTDRTYTNPRDLDVDHVVALADAWVSGAWAWADELLDRFSNDLGNLNAIATGENRSKSARGPADYSPTAPGARCEYLVQYATVKIRWQLSITPQDFDALAAGLRVCGVGVVPNPPAAVLEAPPSAPPPPKTTVGPQSTATTTSPASDCHPAYDPCLPNLPGDALNCGDLRSDQKPVIVLITRDDPYRLDRDGDGRGCTS